MAQMSHGPYLPTVVRKRGAFVLGTSQTYERLDVTSPHSGRVFPWRPASAFTPTAETLQSLDRNIKPAALFIELLDNLVTVHRTLTPGALAY